MKKACILSGWEFISKDGMNGLGFILDGKTFSIYEDPQDSYRSVCTDIKFESLKIKRFSENVPVRISHTDKRLLLKDIRNNEIILEAGTDYSDKWYPCAILKVYPENIYSNKEQDEQFIKIPSLLQ